MKLPLECFLFLSLHLKESFLKTYFSKDKNEKEHYFKFVTQCYWCETSIANIQGDKIVLHVPIVDRPVKYSLSK